MVLGHFSSRHGATVAPSLNTLGFAVTTLVWDGTAATYCCCCCCSSDDVKRDDGVVVVDSVAIFLEATPRCVSSSSVEEDVAIES